MINQISRTAEVLLYIFEALIEEVKQIHEAVCGGRFHVAVLLWVSFMLNRITSAAEHKVFIYNLGTGVIAIVHNSVMIWGL